MTLFPLFFRTVLIYALVIGGLRFAGKRQLGELSTSEFAVTILVSELACIPLQDAAIPMLGGIVPLLTLLSIEILLSCLCCRSRRARKLLCGNSCVVVKDGKLDHHMLRLLRLCPEDLLEGMRLAGITRIQDIRYAIVETNGQLSIIPYADRQPMTPDDVHLHPDEGGLPMVVVLNGTVITENLQQLGKTIAWLERQCKRRGVQSFSDIYMLTLDDCDNFFLQKKTEAST